MKVEDWPGWFILSLELVGVLLMAGAYLAARSWWRSRPNVPEEELAKWLSDSEARSRALKRRE